MKLLQWLDEHFERSILIFVTTAMLAMLGAAVFSRYVINMSISWAEELSIFGMVYMTYFGASYAAKYRRHIRISIFRDMCNQKNRCLIDILCNIAFIIFLLFLVYGSWKMTVLAYETGQKASASGFPRFLAIGSLPVAFTLTIVRLLVDTKKLWNDYTILRAGGTVEETGPVVTIKMDVED
ncbi:TRAP transporter small permease [Desulfovibrio sp. OttesenSCG-928-I05]|nr:TRAP transporter small permease [Desulfovibrio sp. OttesenSCG-928-I05]